MSSYPPPPPPPPPGGPNQPNQGGQPGYPYPPNSTSYNRAVWKAQRQAAKQQAKWARQQMKMQRRAMRPRSIVGPLVLVALGVVFLLAQMGRLNWPDVVSWYARWWPLVLVAAGLVLLGEWTLDQQAHANGQPYRGRTLGGGVVFLLVLLTLVGLSSHEAYRHWHWGDNHQWGFAFPDIDMALGDRHDYDDSVSQAIKDGGALLIRNPHGDVTVTGTSDDGQVHVSVHKECYARTDSAAEAKENQLQPSFSGDSGDMTLNVASVEGGQADLTLQVPRTVMVTVRADHGDVDVEEMHAAVSVTANKGEVNLSGVNGAVAVHMNDEDSSFSAHSVTGSVNMDGRAGDINVSEVTGPVSLTGDFFGTTHLEQVNGALSFKTSRTQFEAARLDGAFDVSLDADLEASQILGPVKLTTRDRGVSLDRVQGGVSLVNRNGSVSVTSAAPLGDISISNSKGSVDLGLPAGTGFVVNAQTRNGDVEDDFGLKQQGPDDHPMLMGTVNGGGPQVNIVTTDGDVTVRKTAVAPLVMPVVKPHIVVSPKTSVNVGPDGVHVMTPGVNIDVPNAPSAPKAPRMPKHAAPAPPTPPSDF